ncbi:hypothetical protein [Salinactinospora qingdaonensis]|uniref:Aminoglycoside phosphotransferase n=1 Tax=Salinactinospora qingdaonensis TaxID=702744 RepID=A0ABP7FRY3_9ACTN
MRAGDIEQARATLLKRIDAAESITQREVLHSWELSHVERIRFSGGHTVIFKCASDPFTHEHEALSALWQAGVDVPRLRVAVRSGPLLGMVLEDMGEPDRVPEDADGVAAAVHLHAAATPPHLPPADHAWLASLPDRALRSLRLLQEKNRWEGVDDITRMLQQLSVGSVHRCEGVLVPPYGWVHSEFHPESLHIRDERVRLYDFARAFHGPGLLDLASWHGTVDEPDPAATRGLLEAYVAAGGESGALASRGGLEAEHWALGWHRVWAVEWFLSQALVWIDDPAADPAYISVVRRHAGDAVTLLAV